MPSWASWNIGVFLCVNCAGIHRSIGVHVSKVKSLSLDQWTAEQISSVASKGNAVNRAIYEATLPLSFVRPNDTPTLKQFILDKYVHKKVSLIA